MQFFIANYYFNGLHCNQVKVSGSKKWLQKGGGINPFSNFCNWWLILRLVCGLLQTFYLKMCIVINPFLRIHFQTIFSQFRKESLARPSYNDNRFSTEIQMIEIFFPLLATYCIATIKSGVVCYCFHTSIIIKLEKNRSCWEGNWFRSEQATEFLRFTSIVIFPDLTSVCSMILSLEFFTGKQIN